VFYRFVTGLVIALLVQFVLIAPTRAQSPQDTLAYIESANVASGIKTYRDGRWGVVKSVVVNPLSDEAQVLLSVGPEDDRSARFCNRAWLPPNSRRILLTPIRIPDGKSAGNQVALESMLIHTADGREKAGPPQTGMVLRKDEVTNSALLAGDGDLMPAALVSALRASVRLNASNTLLAASDMPVDTLGYDALDVLFISSGTPDLNPAQVDAIRQWLLRGGRVWIMIQDAAPQYAQAMLGEDWGITVLDSVRLTDVTFDNLDQTPRHFDYPVDFLRVLAQGYEVSHQVGGYPAALHKTIGKGQLIVTTLAPAAWLEDDGGATHALQQLGRFVRRDLSLVAGQDRAAEAFAGYTRAMIAYSILGRAPVLGIIALFALLIATSAFLLGRKSRLEFVAPLAMVMSLIASIVIVAMGINQQSTTPTSVVTAQLVLMDDDQPYAQIDSVTGVFTSAVDRGPAVQLKLREGGRAWPDLAGRGSGHFRVVWSDPDDVAFENLDMPSGAVRRLNILQSVAVTQPMRFEMGFDEDGITGRLTNGPDTVVKDPLIVTPAGTLAPTIDSDGRVRAGLGEVLLPGQFGNTGLIERDQAGRMEVYKQLLADLSPTQQPVIYFWQERSLAGAHDDSDTYRHAESLVAVPIAVSRAQPGTRVCVPAPFMKMTVFREPIDSELIPSAIYNAETGQWYTGLSEPMLVLMRFSVPEEVGPVRIESAQLSFDLRAPGRGYQVATVDGKKLTLLPGGANPLGRTTITLSGDQLPGQQPDGSVIVGLNVGSFTDPDASRGWSLETLSLSVIGAVE
jgi:hypothetical protein